MMKNMSPEQIANMQRMAANMGMGGPGMPPPTTPQAPPSSALPPAQKADMDKAESLKQEANGLFKTSKFEDASAKYMGAIN